MGVVVFAPLGVGEVRGWVPFGGGERGGGGKEGVGECGLYLSSSHLLFLLFNGGRKINGRAGAKRGCI